MGGEWTLGHGTVVMVHRAKLTFETLGQVGMQIGIWLCMNWYGIGTEGNSVDRQDRWTGGVDGILRNSEIEWSSCGSTSAE